ncbi:MULTISPECIES: tail fiber assembly protein [Citrobacter]|uniref:tail fiber assembly protein n=2 Tax=Enterobacteriaceae TaxID=543 RepID=UPI0016486A12|nr:MULTISPECIES: tail fiber assembly protein [Citrobacter]MCS0535914.1 tail fiber assembly protein [Citrobacter portucalensis]MDM2914140.1 tail fiber assembly protein [Citrobacter sp. Cpo035]MDV1611678.1 tail fiber assembly protein [Citrobacter portucalensis]MEB0545818.1 tail fiber assembly protein [Citrobacter portucalensis]
MKPVFDENGLATEPGEMRCFYFDEFTSEYTGWSDEYIHLGVSMPGYSTDINPGDEVAGEVAVFTGGAWIQQEDHRGTVVYSTADGLESVVDYIGEIKSGFTQLMPVTRFDKWDGGMWVTDNTAAHAADIAAAEAQRQQLLVVAQQRITVWQTKLLMGRKLTENESNQLNIWMDYIDALEAVDVSTAPSIEWPAIPA